MPSRRPDADPLLDREIVSELIRSRLIKAGIEMAKQRRALKLTQGQLAGLTGISISTISRYESGVYPPKDEDKICIATVLVKEVADIWPHLTTAEARERAIELAA